MVVSIGIARASSRSVLQAEFEKISIAFCAKRNHNSWIQRDCCWYEPFALVLHTCAVVKPLMVFRHVLHCVIAVGDHGFLHTDSGSVVKLAYVTANMLPVCELPPPQTF